jgi:hypothetical protein
MKRAVQENNKMNEERINLTVTIEEAKQMVDLLHILEDVPALIMADGTHCIYSILATDEPLIKRHISETPTQNLLGNIIKDMRAMGEEWDTKDNKRWRSQQSALEARLIILASDT